MFYNTANETGNRLELARASALTQEQRIYNLFKMMAGTAMTAWQVHAYVGGEMLITSTGMAITDLVAQGKLKVKAKKVTGPHGRNVNAYEVAQ